MFGRTNPAWLAFGGSLVLLALLVGLLWWTSYQSAPGPSSEPIVVQCAASMRPPLEVIARNYEQETGQRIELRFGPSEHLLTQLSLPPHQTDLFLPADESYITLAQESHLLAEVIPLARMTAVALVKKDNPKKISQYEDIFEKDVKLIQGNEGTAIGKLTQEQLTKDGRWAQLKKHTHVMAGTVTEVANAVKLGSADVGIVWDAVAVQYPDLLALPLPELKKVTARVEIAVAKESKRPTQALRFASYVASKDKGQPILRKMGFADLDPGDASAKQPELIVYAGAMLQPAIRDTVAEFEKREGVKVTTVYNGCGILVSQMKAGERPDVYFSCDPTFMNQVKDLFPKPTVMSSNQLVIAVPKGNPKAISKLVDLGKEGLRVGVGHEQQCALGAITKETFLQSGVYAQVRKNVVVESPTGDYLINQLRTKSLDAVVAYISNVTPYEKDLDAIPVTGIPCAAPQQPIAVRKDTTKPQLSQRFLDALKTEESRVRFEKLGFRWEQKP